MYVNETSDTQEAVHNDPRITPLGKILRMSHIDEFPQFLNILKGEMSFVGPRPERPHFTVKYGEQIAQSGDRTLNAKPGLTGLAQIILGYDDSIDSIVRKSYFDLEGVDTKEKWNLVITKNVGAKMVMNNTRERRVFYYKRSMAL